MACLKRKEVIQAQTSFFDLSTKTDQFPPTLTNTVFSVLLYFSPVESRIQKGMRDLILNLYSQGRSYTQISRATTVSKPTISKIVKQYADSNVFAKGSNGLVLQNGGGPISIQDMYDGMDDDMDEEKEMIVDEDAGEDDDEQ